MGTASYYLVNRSRNDPYLIEQKPRELMINVWYPGKPQSNSVANNYSHNAQSYVKTIFAQYGIPTNEPS